MPTCHGWASCRSAGTGCGEEVKKGATVLSFQGSIGPTRKKEYGPFRVAANTAITVVATSATADSGVETGQGLGSGDLAVRFLQDDSYPPVSFPTSECRLDLENQPPQRCSILASATNERALVTVRGWASSAYSFDVEYVVAQPSVWACHCKCPVGG